jgi:serine/threonine protein phosphatase PrpC
MIHTPTIVLRAAAATHEGRVRTNNEDAFSAEHGVYLVADGMGGHQAGEVASQLAVATLEKGRGALGDSGDLTTLVGEANAAILAHGDQQPDQRGMGTTLTGLVVVGDLTQSIARVAVINVGDSRTYRWRGGTLEQLTTDHSYVQDLVASGMLTPAEARRHPRRNIVTRALGVESVVVPDIVDVEVLPGDRFVVCSDGLVDEVPDVDLAAALTGDPPAEDLANTLVQMALTNGGRDNVTVVVVDAVVSDPVEAPSTPMEPTPPPSLPVPPAAVVAGRRRRLVGIALFVVGLIVVVGATLVAVGAYARSGYYVDFDDDDEVVVVYRGRPGGVWWFDPTTLEITDLRRDELGPVDIERIAAQPTFGARRDVTLYLTTVTTTTTTTTTTIPR